MDPVNVPAKFEVHGFTRSRQHILYNTFHKITTRTSTSPNGDFGVAPKILGVLPPWA